MSITNTLKDLIRFIIDKEDARYLVEDLSDDIRDDYINNGNKTFTGEDINELRKANNLDEITLILNNIQNNLIKNMCDDFANNFDFGDIIDKCIDTEHDNKIKQELITIMKIIKKINNNDLSIEFNELLHLLYVNDKIFI